MINVIFYSGSTFTLPFAMATLIRHSLNCSFSQQQATLYATTFNDIRTFQFIRIKIFTYLYFTNTLLSPSPLRMTWNKKANCQQNKCFVAIYFHKRAILVVQMFGFHILIIFRGNRKSLSISRSVYYHSSEPCVCAIAICLRKQQKKKKQKD